MDKLLRQFYNDEHLREAVKAFLISFLGEQAIARVMERKDTTAIADANEFILKAFIRLDEEYRNVPKPVMKSSR